MASDQVAGHYFINTTCDNCNNDYTLKAIKPSPAWRGWFGGCGTKTGNNKFDCTGPNNYLVKDFTGDFFGHKGTILANNSVIGNNIENCTFSAKMNSHMCLR